MNVFSGLNKLVSGLARPETVGAERVRAQAAAAHAEPPAFRTAPLALVADLSAAASGGQTSILQPEVTLRGIASTMNGVFKKYAQA